MRKEKTMNKFDRFECMDCGGDGIVIGKTGDGDIHEWECPECNNGWVDYKAHVVQESAWLGFTNTMSQVKA